ncbi:MAG: M14 family metallopeptidase [Planctomycetaceae bacterium]
MPDIVKLKAKQIDGARPGPHLLITGGVHGDEFEPMAAIRRLMGWIEPAQLSGRVTLVPVVNEAAYLCGQRTADDGLDIARVCPGRADGSITERTAFALSQWIRAADYYIDLHTGGTALEVLPLTGYTLHSDRTVLEAQRRMARAFNLPVIWGTPGLPGRSLSVAAGARVPAIYAEYRGGGRCDPAGIEAYVDGCMNVMGELKMIEREPPQSKIQHIVEDNRPNAGFMQIQNPSPMTGFFEPSVKLGDAINIDDALGTVSDAPGTNVATVRARQAGIVLVLRTFSRVLEGESVGVILETERDCRDA